VITWPPIGSLKAISKVPSSEKPMSRSTTSRQAARMSHASSEYRWPFANEMARLTASLGHLCGSWRGLTSPVSPRSRPRSSPQCRGRPGV
jgi:hypothetical protein